MEPRIRLPKVIPGGLQAMLGLSNHLRNSGLEESLLTLIYLRRKSTGVRTVLICTGKT